MKSPRCATSSARSTRSIAGTCAAGGRVCEHGIARKSGNLIEYSSAILRAFHGATQARASRSHHQPWHLLVQYQAKTRDVSAGRCRAEPIWRQERQPDQNRDSKSRIKRLSARSVIGAACSHAVPTVDDQRRDSRPVERHGSGNWGDQNKEATRSEFIVKNTISSQEWELRILRAV